MRLFLAQANWQNDTLTLDRDVKKRLVRVMRMRPGDRLEVATPQQRWESELQEITPDGVILKKISDLPSRDQNRIRLILGQAIPKGDRFEWLIQKVTELGVSEIHPLVTQRTIVRPENSAKKVQRWNEIATAAAEQSESDQPCSILPPEPLKIFLQRPFEGIKLILHEREGAVSLKDILKKNNYYNNSIIFIVGPEGGWTKEETATIEQAGFQKVHLGSRILRSETAGLVLAAIIQYETTETQK
ncbi:16S rRNA (uracil(1498)-N(3))-methyltransferase [bacterium]|nr:16S rRNA (uracil(1498)-N(3))-methyltransferase [bacterium]